MTTQPEFDRHAKNYRETLNESVGWSGGGAEEFAQHKAGLLKRRFNPQRVLDFGCGVGLLSGYLRESFPDAVVDGFDPSEESIEEVSAELTKQGTFTTHLDELGGAYDLIVVSNVLHHVAPKHRPEFMRDVFTQLSPGGHLAVFEHNPFNPLTRYIVATCDFDEDAILLTPNECRNLAKKAGLEVEHLHFILFFPPFLRKLWSKERHLRFLPLGAQYTCIARKK